MSRPELYAVASLLSAVGIAGYYIIAVFGLPDGLEGFGDQLGSIFIRVIVISFFLQLIVDTAQSIGALQIDKDERDRMIEGKAFRNAYYVLIVVVFAAIGHLAVTGLLGERLDSTMLVSLPLLTLHLLVLGVFAAVSINAVSRLYLYRRG